MTNKGFKGAAKAMDESSDTHICLQVPSEGGSEPIAIEGLRADDGATYYDIKQFLEACKPHSYALPPTSFASIDDVLFVGERQYLSHQRARRICVDLLTNALNSRRDPLPIVDAILTRADKAIEWCEWFKSMEPEILVASHRGTPLNYQIRYQRTDEAIKEGSNLVVEFGLIP